MKIELEDDGAYEKLAQDSLEKIKRIRRELQKPVISNGTTKTTKLVHNPFKNE